MPLRSLAPCLALFVMAACSSPPGLQERRLPVPPPGAVATIESGPQEQRLDEVIVQVREAVQDPKDPLKIVTYRLPPGSDWAAVSTYYEQAVSWTQDTRLAENLRGAQARAWRHDGEVFAIALVVEPVAGGAVEPPRLIVATSD